MQDTRTERRRRPPVTPLKWLFGRLFCSEVEFPTILWARRETNVGRLLVFLILLGTVRPFHLS